MANDPIKIPMDIINSGIELVAVILVMLFVIDIISWFKVKNTDIDYSTIGINILRMVLYPATLYLIINGNVFPQKDWPNHILVSIDYLTSVPLLLVEGASGIHAVIKRICSIYCKK